MSRHNLDTSPSVSDEIRKTTCYMCACRCGINVHLKDGKIRYIEGNKDHPVNQVYYVPRVVPALCSIMPPRACHSPLSG